MSIHDMIKKYGTGRGEGAMWKSVHAISDFIDRNTDKESNEYKSLEKCLYSILCGEHFDEDYGRKQIESMFYVDSDGSKRMAPYWTDDKMHNVYEQVKGVIPSEYTEWDFLVTMNMMMADYVALLRSWYPNVTDDELGEKCIEMAIAWLNDPDAKHNGKKVWYYFYA